MKSRDVQSEEEERFDTGCVNINVTRSSLFCVGIARLPIPVAVRSKVWVCGRSLARTAGSNFTGCVNISLVSVWCQVQVSATGRSLVQRSPTEAGVYGVISKHRH